MFHIWLIWYESYDMTASAFRYMKGHVFFETLFTLDKSESFSYLLADFFKLICLTYWWKSYVHNAQCIANFLWNPNPGSFDSITFSVLCTLWIRLFGFFSMRPQKLKIDLKSGYHDFISCSRSLLSSSNWCLKMNIRFFQFRFSDFTSFIKQIQI